MPTDGEDYGYPSFVPSFEPSRDTLSSDQLRAEKYRTYTIVLRGEITCLVRRNVDGQLRKVYEFDKPMRIAFTNGVVVQDGEKTSF